MAQLNFAKLDANNIVTQILVVDESNAATEAKGQHYLRTILTDPTAVWKLYSGKGLIYDPTKKIFHQPQPYPSWTLNEALGNWDPPIPKPVRTTDGDKANDGRFQQWNEVTQSWDVETAIGSGIYEPEA